VTSNPPARRAQPLVISWIRYHGRSDGMARAIGGRAVWMPWARSGGPLAGTVVGWLRSGARTVRLVLAVPRGGLVVVMCPPVFALVAALAAARPRGVRVAADLHSSSVNDAGWAWSHGLLRRCMRHCSHLIVTNDQLLDGFDTGGRPVLVIHDPPVALPEGGTPPCLPPGPVVVFPSSGGADEPLQALVQAARLLRGEATVVITGRQPGLRGELDVVLPGYLTDQDYAALLRRADVVLALTTREATMQRAGYEALELGRPLVCSDTAVLREAFHDAAVFTGSGAEEIAEAVRLALHDSERLSRTSARVRSRMRAEVAAAVRALT
jgi:glycosyltransferase involved in cell wall biosynthesis